jgi:peptide/nickel transport system permease protein
MRMTRTMMLEVLKQDYIRTAWAKGLRERTVIWRHTLKKALIPLSPSSPGDTMVSEHRHHRTDFRPSGHRRLLLDGINNRISRS